MFYNNSETHNNEHDNEAMHKRIKVETTHITILVQNLRVMRVEASLYFIGLLSDLDSD
jgi:hypothetical protein